MKTKKYTSKDRKVWEELRTQSNYKRYFNSFMKSSKDEEMADKFAINCCLEERLDNE